MPRRYGETFQRDPAAPLGRHSQQQYFRLAPVEVDGLGFLAALPDLELIAQRSRFVTERDAKFGRITCVHG
jgi:hypothetical protein